MEMNPAVSTKAWARAEEAGHSPFRGRRSSGQDLLFLASGPLPEGPVPSPPYFSSSSWFPPVPLGESEPLPFGDPIPKEKQSSRECLVPVPTQLCLSSELGLS